MSFDGPFPFHGVLEWIPAEKGGRAKPLPVSSFAAVGWRQDVGSDGMASLLLRGFEPGRRRSRADARWLVPRADAQYVVSVGDVIIVGEGSRPVARFHVDAVDPLVEEVS